MAVYRLWAYNGMETVFMGVRLRVWLFRVENREWLWCVFAEPNGGMSQMVNWGYISCQPGEVFRPEDGFLVVMTPEDLAAVNWSEHEPALVASHN